jgi:pyruvate kinase
VFRAPLSFNYESVFQYPVEVIYLFKKTKIICTVGPASAQKETIKKMHQLGMNGVRINTAYGNIPQYQSTIEAVRAVAEIPIILDLKGPEVRLKAKEPKVIRANDVFEVGFDGEEICFNHNFYDQVTVGDSILIDNGKIKTQIIEKGNRKLFLQAITGGKIEDGKGVNIPNKHLSVSTLSKKDLTVIDFAKKHDVEYAALSFTRCAADVEELSKKHRFEGGIIAKIENSEGVKNAPEILEAANGIMVARGDLGVEIEPEKVPLAQKSLIKQCNQRGKLVITATEMLESMIHQSSPTRAEVSDVANAILDGSDAVMLSGETAIGQYPVEAVDMMARIAHETESAVKSKVEATHYINISDTVSKAIQEISQSMPLDQVIALTRTGYTARMIARFKIAQPIIAVTPDVEVKKQLELVFGVKPVLIDYLGEKDIIASVAQRLWDLKMVDAKETVLFTAGKRTTIKHASNAIEIHRIEELLNYASS